jgi:hypothetical protein
MAEVGQDDILDPFESVLEDILTGIGDLKAESKRLLKVESDCLITAARDTRPGVLDGDLVWLNLLRRRGGGMLSLMVRLLQ